MSTCSPLQIAEGYFTGKSEWSSLQRTVKGNRSVDLIDTELTIRQTGKVDLVHSNASATLQYAFFGDDGNLLILESEQISSSSKSYTVILVDFTGVTLSKRTLFALREGSSTDPPVERYSPGSAPPVVRYSPGSGAAFLIYVHVHALDNSSPNEFIDEIAVHRSDDGDVLLSVSSLVPSGQIQAELLGSVLWIRHPGGAVSAPLWKVGAPHTDFEAPLGGQETRLVEFKNAGKDCLTIQEIAGQSATWTVSPSQLQDQPQTLPVCLLPGETFTVAVTFTPHETGEQEAELAIKTDPQSSSTLSVKGTGRDPVSAIGFEPDPLVLDFGTINVDTIDQQQVRIWNAGDVTLVVTCGGPTAGSRFSWVAWVGQAQIPAGGSKEIMISFTPDGESSFSDSLVITSNAPGSPHTLVLSGQGHEPVVLAQDLYIRDNLQDDGSEPLVGGGLAVSPDVILRNALVTDPQGELGSAAAMQQDTLSEPVEAGQDNYLYLRITNRGTQANNGGGGPDPDKVIVYWIEPTALPSPNLWTKIEDEIEIPPIQPQQTRVVGPMTWPAGKIPGQGHYCFVALIHTSAEHAVDPAQIIGQSNFQNLIRSKNNVTWRNFDVIDAFPGTRQAMKIHLGAWQGTPIRSDLKVDVRPLPNDVSVTLRVPRPAAKAAARDGLTLTRETDLEYTFQVDKRRVCTLAGMSIEPARANQAILEMETSGDTPIGEYRVSLAQEVLGREMGRVSSQLSIGDHPYVGNPRTHELHEAGCERVQHMNRQRVAFRTIDQALKRGYNGCRYCLPQYDSDR